MLQVEEALDAQVVKVAKLLAWMERVGRGQEAMAPRPWAVKHGLVKVTPVDPVDASDGRF